MIDASTLKVGDIGCWDLPSVALRCFVVCSNDGFQINCRYLDNDEMFYTHGFQSLIKIEMKVI